MNLRIRLYKLHDLDLIGCFLYDKRFFIATIKNCLHEYSLGEPVKDISFKCPVIDNKELQTSYSLCVALTDKASIDLIQSIDEGWRNSFVKNLLRSFINIERLDFYFDTPFEKTEPKTKSLKKNTSRTQNISEQKHFTRSKELLEEEKISRQEIISEKEQNISEPEETFREPEKEFVEEENLEYENNSGYENDFEDENTSESEILFEMNVSNKKSSRKEFEEKDLEDSKEIDLEDKDSLISNFLN